MRIKHLHLKAFGPFTNRDLDLSKGNGKLQIIHGLNEAGKSSLLRAITNAFFGFETQCGDDFLHNYKDFCIGAELILDGGGEYAFERVKRTKNSLRKPSGETLQESELQGILGVQRAVFLELFGLNQETLRAGGRRIVEGEGDLARSLFESGGLASLVSIGAALNDDARALFLKGGQRELNTLFKEIQELRAAVKSTVLHSEEYIAKETRAGEVDASLEQARARQSQLAMEHSRLLRVKGNKSELAEYDSYALDLAALGPVPDLSSGASQDRVAVSTTLHQAEERRAELQQAVEVAEAELAAIPADPPLLEFSAQIASLDVPTVNYRQQRADSPGLARRAEAALASAEHLWNASFPGQDISALETITKRVEEQAIVRQLLDQLHGIEIEEKAHRKTLRDGEEELERRSLELQALPSSTDTRVLDGIIAALPNAQELARQLQKVSREADTLSAAVSLQSRKLMGAWKIDADILTMDVPTAETISRYEGEFDDIAMLLRDSREKQRACGEKQSDAAFRIEQENLSGSVPTLEELLAEREVRDRGWQLIRSSAIDGQLSLADAELQYQSGTPIADVFEGHIRVADTLADDMRANSDRVVRIAELRLQLQRADTELIQVKAEIEKFKEDESCLSAEWAQLWVALGGTPHNPREMREWSQQRDIVILRIHELNAKNREREDAVIARDNALSQLSTALIDLGEPAAGKHEPLAAVVERAKTFVADRKNDREQRKDCDRRIRELEVKLPKLREQVSKDEQVRVGWQQQWDIAAGKLDVNFATIGQVRQFLDKLPEIVGYWRDYKNLYGRVQGIEDETKQYTAKVRELLPVIADDLLLAEPDAAAAELKRRHGIAQLNAARRDELENGLRQTHANLKLQEQKKQQATDRLDVLCRAAGCSSLEELPAIEAAVITKRDLTTKLDQITRSLCRSNSTGFGEVRTEADGVSSDFVLVHLNDVASEENTISSQIESLVEERTTIRNALELAQDATAHAANVDGLQSKIAAARLLAERYVRLRLAGAVLERTLLRYQQKYESPLLERASELFSRLTDHRFERLTTQVSENDRKVLAAVRGGSGKLVEVDGLSDGTADQLFLALRLAAIQEHLTQSETVPCIFDDVVVNFDDGRSRTVLQVLADMARRSQILLFTHHDHIVKLAEDQIPGQFEVYRLETSALASSAVAAM